MSRAQRIGLVVAAVAVVVVAFLLLRPGRDDRANGHGTGTPAVTAPAGHAVTTDRERPDPVTRIRVRDREPVGGVTKMEVAKGDEVGFEVTADAPEEVHVHGYDLSAPVGPGRRARLKFRADLEGAYEVELEHSATQIAELRVRP